MAMDPGLFRSATKQYLNEQQLQAITRKAFGCGAAEISEAGEGQFNAAYFVTTEAGQRTVLKVAPAVDTPVLTYERGAMHSEVEAMKFVSARTDLPLARVLYYDESHDIVPGDWFFSERFDAESLSAAVEAGSLTDAELAEVRRDVARATRTLNDIIGEGYGYFDRPCFGKTWHEAYRKMQQNVFDDAKAGGVDLGIDTEAVLRRIDELRDVWNEVTEPHLVHWDIWDANVFVKDGKLCGIIDFERCHWGDPLMEFGFRAFVLNDAFVADYGKPEGLSENEKLRARWYDFYLLSIMATEGAYRKYEDGGEMQRFAIKALGEMLPTL